MNLGVAEVLSAIDIDSAEVYLDDLSARCHLDALKGGGMIEVCC